MKLRKGERIVCSKGHHVGDVLDDVSENVPVPTEAFSINDTQTPDISYGYVCGQCNNTVASRESDGRWRVRTARGWVS